MLDHNSTACLSIAGEWGIRLDPEDIGIAESWETLSFEDVATLPGSLDLNGIGEPNLVQDYMGGLSRKVRYIGPAWFTRTIEVPAEWKDRELVLTLERVHWFSQLWVNGNELGSRDSLSVPHIYRFRAGSDSSIKFVVRIDNTPLIPIGRICHALTDWTQTNWNGIIGEMSLRPADVAGAEITRAESLLSGLRVTGKASPDEPVRLFVDDSEEQAAVVSVDADGRFSALIPKASLPRWSDFSPQLFEVKVRCGDHVDRLKTGYRSFLATGQKLRLNDLPVFLRGTLECCVFPKTGFPSMDSQSWIELMEKAREYGLNHIRFHSWCPPEAAFAAADEVGILIQAELPLWTGNWPVSSDASLMEFCRREAFRILETYGHHPSLCLFTLGNEIAFYGEEPEVDRLLEDLKEAFPSVLFNFSSHGNFLSNVCDYYVQADNGKPGAENLPLRGSTWYGVGSRFDREPPATKANCSEATAQFDRPVIAHEVAEWAVFPNIDRAGDYDGVLEARNFASIRRQLRARGMENQAERFTYASGRLSAQLYKEEIETLLRTENLAGFQLLGLTDFPGQGTATVGMLDAFWKEKGFIDGRQLREFCSPTVPLLEISKFVWTSRETLKADVLAFHSGEPVRTAATWALVTKSGEEVAVGRLGEHDMATGQATALGPIYIELQELAPASCYELIVVVPDLGVNRWDVWVFPTEIPKVEIPDVAVFRWYREDVRQALKAGKTVWLRLHPAKIWGGIAGRFAPAFWSPIHFREQVGTMGTLIQAENPLFAEFPTEEFTQWHWWEILTRSKALVLDALPAGFRPQLQVIDRYERNHKLGTIFEATVGGGRLLVTCIDFDSSGRPAAAQLEHSIKTHLASGEFEPSQSISFAELDGLFDAEP